LFEVDLKVLKILIYLFSLGWEKYKDPQIKLTHFQSFPGLNHSSITLWGIDHRECDETVLCYIP
jgi:hypothetical protein